MFCHITQTWRGTPLTSHLTVVELIASTTTKTGLSVRCELDTRLYAKGIKVSDEEMATLNIKGDTFHPESPNVVQVQFSLRRSHLRSRLAIVRS